MQSKWIELKEEAIQLRKKGTSIKTIEVRLGIARSTLSGWLRSIQLTDEQKEKLKKNHENALVHARVKAVLWHNQQKAIRLKLAEENAMQTLNQLNLKDAAVLDLALAFLYLGEGAKTSDSTLLGNSNPIILNFFIAVLVKNYNLKIEKISCFLHLRADQDPDELKQYWSKVLEIPLQNFKKASIDQRTLGVATYPGYKGVCVLNCGSVAIQRKLVYLSNAFCQKIINERGD